MTDAIFAKSPMIRVGTRVCFNTHKLSVRDVLCELVDKLFVVTGIDEDYLLTLHSLPLDGPHPNIVMGVETRLLIAEQA